MKLYRIKDWNKHFENDRSRTRNKCSFVCVPNKQHGMGFSYLMAEIDGATIYGVFHLIVGACSQQSPPRHGLLTADGELTGSPWGPDDMAVKFRRPAKEISRALEVLSSERVGWIEVLESSHSPPTHRPVTANSPPTHLEGKGREEKEGKGREDASLFPPPPADTVETLMVAWNEVGAFSAVKELSDKRKKGANSRLKDDFFRENWRAALARILESRFCRGENERGWRADFDWFLQPDVCLKIMEGKYDNRNGATPLKSNPVRNAI